MNQEKEPSEFILVVESALSPMRAIENAALVAKVRGEIDYRVFMVGPRRWKVTLTKGTMEDLRKAIQMARDVKIVETK